MSSFIQYEKLVCVSVSERKRERAMGKNWCTMGYIASDLQALQWRQTKYSSRVMIFCRIYGISHDIYTPCGPDLKLLHVTEKN